MTSCVHPGNHADRSGLIQQPIPCSLSHAASVSASCDGAPSFDRASYGRPMAMELRQFVGPLSPFCRRTSEWSKSVCKSGIWKPGQPYRLKRAGTQSRRRAGVHVPLMITGRSSDWYADSAAFNAVSVASLCSRHRLLSSGVLGGHGGCGSSQDMAAFRSAHRASTMGNCIMSLFRCGSRNARRSVLGLPCRVVAIPGVPAPRQCAVDLRSQVWRYRCEAHSALHPQP